MEQHWTHLSDGLKLSDQSRKRIRAQLASQPIQQEVISMKKKTLHWHRVLIAAALCVALAITALAVGLTVEWENFLGRTPREAVTTVGESAVTGDYTLTIQEAIVDDDGAALLLALTRNDGGVIQGDPHLSGNIYNWDVKIDGQFPNMGRDYLQSVRSEDGKTVWFCTEFKVQDGTLEDGSLAGHTISFLCKGLVDMARSEEELALTYETVSLAPLAQTVRTLDMSYSDAFGGENEPTLMSLVEELSAQVTVPLTRMEPGAAEVAAVLFAEDGGPVVVVGWHEDRVQQGQFLTNSCVAAALTDTRTGERWGCTGYVRRGQEDDFYLCDFKDCPLTAEDLPYVEATVHYNTDKILSDQPVELTFSANVGRQETMALDEDIAFYYYGDCAVHITQARLSALRLRLTFDHIDRGEIDLRSSDSNTQWALVEENGTRLLLLDPTIRTDKETGTGYIDLEARSEAWERRLIDPDQVIALALGDVEIPLD